VQPLATIVIDAHESLPLLRSVITHASEQVVIRDAQETEVVEDSVRNVVGSARLPEKIPNGFIAFTPILSPLSSRYLPPHPPLVCRPHLTGFIQEPLQELVREKELLVEVQNSELAPFKMSHVPVRQHSIIDLNPWNDSPWMEKKAATGWRSKQETVLRTVQPG